MININDIAVAGLQFNAKRWDIESADRIFFLGDGEPISQNKSRETHHSE